jgi:hypothetical protein
LRRITKSGIEHRSARRMSPPPQVLVIADRRKAKTTMVSVENEA